MPLLFLILLPLFGLCAAGAALLHYVRRRRAESAQKQQEAERQARDDRRAAARAATGGKLHLCEPDEIAGRLRGERLWSLPLLEASDVARFRRHLRQAAARRGLAGERLDDLCSCVSEAAARAIRHSGGGAAQVWAAEDGFLVLVSDCGAALEIDAWLNTEAGQENGQEGDGLDLRLMLALADSVAVCTGADGTQLVLTIGA